MENWRNYFESSGADIWTVIDKAIGVAAADFPQELRLRRDGLTERMYTAHLLHLGDHDDDVHPRGSDKTNATSGVYTRDEEQDEENDDEPQQRHRRDNDDDAARDMVRDCPLHDERDLVAALDEWDVESLHVKEILAIKESIQDMDQPESEMLDQLQKLESLNISVDMLERTQIGKDINGFRKHSSRRVRAMAKRIVRSWKELVDDWVKSTESQEPLPLSNGNYHPEMGEEEEGLPSPPLDAGALLAARTASLEMSHFFDFDDDDVSAGSGPSPPTSNNLSDEFGSLPDTRRKNDNTDRRYQGTNICSPAQEHDSRAPKGGPGIHKVDKHRPVAVERHDVNSRNVVASTNNFRKPPTMSNGSKPANGNAVPNRPANGYSQQKPNNDYVRKPESRPASNVPTTKPKADSLKPGLATKPKPQGEIDVSQKLLLAKRKLQEGYQQINEAKKQRTVQALDLTDLPKGGPKSARFPQPHMKPVQNRGWANGRR
ncbi:hypothetical protein AXG93_1200s1800 [Marchantia polymorpha subsp. ruderalis]|uniref:TFIIS N-terminal domain-containing protein n=1 Tax=Marchantia polymorpha subsp. ruderalis TaxID=1480154 RepID=A0A176WJI0_MARPO|nr:hypothetical protein AXG93_1200s1800 [Marchantia polymorpha subsp. ruderalis]